MARTSSRPRTNRPGRRNGRCPDPLEPQPHDPDVKALPRLVTLWNVPVATNLATDEMIISSPLMTGDYMPSRPIMDRPSTGAEYLAPAIA
jgi:methylglyoxal synthase